MSQENQENGLNIHKWMTKENFEGILRRELGDVSVIIEDFHAKPAIEKGENYCSEIWRVHVEFTCGLHNKRSQDFIVKSALADKDKQEMMENRFFVFTREIAVYNDILPEAERLLLTVNDKTCFAPSMYGFGKDPHYIIFEDLIPRGFKLMDRMIGMNFEHLQMCLIKVAKFHAATAMLYDLDPSLFVNHHFKNINKEAPEFHEFFKHCVSQIKDKAKTWKGCEKFAVKLEGLEETIMDKVCEVYRDDSSPFRVLNHGDLWCNNLLWKHDKNSKPTDCLLIDFQTGYFGSPGIDLSYLLFNSSSNDIKEEDFDHLLQGYHKVLVDTLITLGYRNRLPTLIDIQCELLKCGMNAVLFSAVLLPIRFLENTANADLNNLLDRTDQADEFRDEMFGSQKMEERMHFLLNYFNRKGLLEA